MPYRRLPNTDVARLRAIKNALDRQAEFVSILLPPTIYYNLKKDLALFESKLNYKKSLQKNFLDKNQEHSKLSKKARLYLSHFVQVINFSIARGELPVSTREYYGIPTEQKSVPAMSSDKSLLKWGAKIIKGEKLRISKGGSIIYNPTIALVNVNFERFRTSYENLQLQEKAYNKAVKELNDARIIADKIIIETWDTIEAHYEDLPKEKARQRCHECGIVYVYRKGELEKLRNQDFSKQMASV